MTQDSEDRIAKIVAHAVTGEHPVVHEEERARRRHGSGSLRVSTGISLVQLLAIAATTGGLFWKLNDMAVRWETYAAKMEERMRAQESWRDQTQPILELVKAKLRLESNGRGGR